MRAEAELSVADLAGRSCPHHFARSGLQHAGGPRREIRRHCHLMVTFYSNKYMKNRGAKGIRTPDLLHAMQTRYQLRHSPSCTPLESLV